MKKLKNQLPIIRYLEAAAFNKNFIQIKKAVELEDRAGRKFYKPLYELNCDNTVDVRNSFITSALMKLDPLEIEYTEDFLQVKDLSDIQRIKLRSFINRK